jgi:uncharacterized membrane protein YbhN (UPF0104 family)
VKWFQSKGPIRVLVAALVTAVLLFLAWHYLSARALSDSWSRINGGYLGAALLAYLVVNGIRAFRFKTAGASLSFSQMFAIASVHSALLRVMPLRSGELAYGILLRRQTGGGFTSGLASIVMLRVLDLAIVLPLGGAVGVLLISKSDWGYTVIALAIALGGLFFALGPITRALNAKLGSKRENDGLGRLLDTLAGAMDITLPRRIALTGLTAILWGAILVWLCLVLWSLDEGITWDGGFVAGVLGITGSVLPVSLIGSFGPMESGFALGLVLLDIPSDIAVAQGVLASALTFACNWLVALPAWLYLFLFPSSSTKEGL